MDIQRIRQNYAELPIEGLRILLAQLDSLRGDAIQALREEFVKRSDVESIQFIDDFEESNNRKFTTEDARQFIQEELSKGQSIQVIKLELMERGINIFDILNQDADMENDAIDYLTSLKSQGVNSHDLREQLGEEFEIEQDKKEKLLDDLKRRGRFNIWWGGLLLTLGIPLLFARIYMGQIPIIALAIISVGIGFVHRGTTQRR